MIDGPSGNIQLEEAPCSSWSFFNGGRTDINIILLDHGRAPDEGALLGTEGGGPQNLANHRVQSIEVGISSTNEVNERLSSFQQWRCWPLPQLLDSIAGDSFFRERSTSVLAH